MTLLLAAAMLPERQRIARGSLADLSASLRHDLDRLLTTPEIWYPAEKARMTRIGGRCPVHGVLLDFDPWSPPLMASGDRLLGSVLSRPAASVTA